MRRTELAEPAALAFAPPQVAAATARQACSNSAPRVQKGALGATGIPAQCTIILSVLYSEGGKRGDTQPDCPKPNRPKPYRPSID